MKTKPPDARYGPILCPQCLHDGVIRRTWEDEKKLTLVCADHGDVFTVQMIEGS